MAKSKKIKVPGFSIYGVRWYDTSMHITQAKVHESTMSYTRKEDAERYARNFNRRKRRNDPASRVRAYVKPIFVWS